MSKISKAVKDLLDLYERASKSDYVNDPVAFALYYTWRKYDNLKRKGK